MGSPRLETIKMYKGRKTVQVNKTDVDKWRGYGFETSADRRKNVKQKKESEAPEGE